MTISSRILTIVGIGAAVLALTGCSTNMHPGNAAVVDGTAISQSEVDSVTTAVCAYVVEAGKQGGQPQDYGIADLKASLTSTLVQFEITRAVADDLGLTVRGARVDQQAARYGLPDGLDAEEMQTVKDYFQDAAEATILQTVIGAHLEDDSVTSDVPVTQDQIDADKPFMTTYFKRADVSVNPSYGTWNGSSIEPGTGSLSDPVATPSDAAALPDAQKCH